MQKRDRQREAEEDTKGSTKEAKEGGEMTREEVVQAALTVERWCTPERCDECPFYCRELWGTNTCMLHGVRPQMWNLEKFLRTRGLKDAD